MSDEPPTENAAAAPRPCFTLFDAFHFLLPLAVGGAVFLLTSRSLGLALTSALAALSAVLSFWLSRYAIPTLVLFLYRRQIGSAVFRRDVACYVVTHFPRDKKQSKNENA